MLQPIRILLLADSHLGFDLPVQPRVERRRRGHDFLANYARALAPALAGEVDIVVHGGDVFDRPRIPASLAYQAYQPFIEIAERGTPVFIVAGNHERSVLPHIRFAAHRNVHIFDRPRTFCVSIRGSRVALAGFPYVRRDVRTSFNSILDSTGWQSEPADVRVLCMHHCVEGATVGPANFTFTTAKDVVRGRDIPAGFNAVFTGHIHRRQVLLEDLRGRRLNAPVLYPGSIERTAIAEMGESKGYMIVDVDSENVHWELRDLPARPMFVEELSLRTCNVQALQSALRSLIEELPQDAVLRIKLAGEPDAEQRKVFSAPNLRRLAPHTMNIEVAGAKIGAVK